MRSRNHFERFAGPAVLLVAIASGVNATETVQDRLAVMDAQIGVLKKEAELNAALQSSAGITMSTMPQVLSVIGLDGKMTARLLFSTGLVSNYNEGDVIRNGMRVASIAPQQVALMVGDKKRTKLIVLDFVSGPTMQSGMPLPSGVMSRPLPKELLPEPPLVASPAMFVPPSAKPIAQSQTPVAPTLAVAPSAPATTAPAK